MQPHEQAQFLAATSRFIKEQISSALELTVAPLIKEIDDLRSRLEAVPRIEEADIIEQTFTALMKNIPQPKDGKDGVDGKDGTVDLAFLQGYVDQKLEVVMASLPTPKDGKDGLKGEDGVSPAVDYFLIGDKVAEMVKTEFEKISVADGKDGEQGPPGEKGEDGKDAVVDEQKIRFAITSEFEDYIRLNPIQHGKDGRDGKSVTVDELLSVVSAAVDKAVAALPRAVDVADCFIDSDGNLRVACNNGQVKQVGCVVGRDGESVNPEFVRELVADLFNKTPKPTNGKDGKDGVDGKDGAGFDFVELEQIDERNFKIVLTNEDGSKRKEFSFYAPAQIHRGMWTDEHDDYDPGDTVTLGGSQWTAKIKTKTRPDTDNPDWFLSVKRGRDGKQGPPGEKGEVVVKEVEKTSKKDYHDK